MIEEILLIGEKVLLIGAELILLLIGLRALR